MLKVFGHIYADSAEKLNVLIESVQNDGFEVAYDSGVSVVVMKEVNDESGDSAT